MEPKNFHIRRSDRRQGASNRGEKDQATEKNGKIWCQQARRKMFWSSGRGIIGNLKKDYFVRLGT